MKKITFIINNKNFGGGEISTFWIIKGLAQYFKIQVYANKEIIEKLNTFIDKYKINNIFTYTINLGYTADKFKGLVCIYDYLFNRYYLKKYIFLNNIVKSKSDLVIFNLLREKILFSAFFYQIGIKVIWIEHAHLPTYLTYNYFFLKIYKKTFSKVSKIICDSFSIKGNISAIGSFEEKLKVIHLGLEDDLYFKKNYKINKKISLACVCNFSKLKGFDFVDKLIDNLKKTIDFKLNFYGVNKEEVFHSNFLKTDNIAYCKFFGKISRSEVLKKIINNDVFISLSKIEGFPLNILEAMKSALPIVAFAVGGIREQIISEKHGILVKKGDIETFANQIIRLSKDEKLRETLGQNARKRFLQNFTYDKMIENYKEIINQVLNNKDK